MTSQVAQSAPRLAGLDLVIVDDDELVLEIVSRYVRNTTIRYQIFFDAEAAINDISRMHLTPRLLVVDYYMPTMTGVEFISQLSERMNLSESSVFLCSAVTPNKKTIKQLHHLGASLIDKSIVSDRRVFLNFLECGEGRAEMSVIDGESGSRVARKSN